MDALRRFAEEYGWRAYAIPVLTVLTVWVFVDILTTPDGSEVDPAAQSSSAVVSDGSAGQDRGGGPDPATEAMVAHDITALPGGGSYAQSGDGTYRVVGTPGAAAGEGKEMTLRYVVEVENGVDTSAYGGDDAVARMIDATLTDPRGWTHDPAFRVEHVSVEDSPTLRIRLSSVETTRELCGPRDLDLETSCRTMVTGESLVIINDARWARGATPFEGDLGSYRQYLINHEVGHALGYAEHVPCGGDGKLGPIMMQQTLSMNNSILHELAPEEVYPDDNATCRYNGWPYPAVAAASSKEG